MSQLPDEAQADLPIQKPQLAAEVTEFSISLSLGASIEVNGKDWVKASSDGGMKWKGIPSPQDIDKAVRYIQGVYLEPALVEMLTLAQKKLVEKQSHM